MLLLATGLPAMAADGEIPDGIPVGPWILAPSFHSSYVADDNPFLKTQERATSDRVTTVGGGILALLPFRKSLLQLDYQASKETYANNKFPRDLTQVADVELELALGSGDKIFLRDVYRRDFARSEEVDPGGELQSFEGQPYNINRWEAELSRTDPRHRGYVVRVRRQDFIYKGDRDIGFFDYRGFENVLEYRQPLPENRSWVTRYETRRFNHYDPFQIEAPTGVPFRREKSDNVMLGLRGFLGEEQPFRVYLGLGRFRYEGLDSTRFDGLVGLAAWRLKLGGRSKLDLELGRRPLPSNSRTYYINNAIRANLEREWRRLESGTELSYYLNNYAEKTADCDERRRDATYSAEAYVGLRFHERLSWRISSFYKRRSSTCDYADYTAAGIATGIALGWF